MKEDFTAYLIKKGFTEKTIQRMGYCANHYLQWLTERNLSVEEVTYKDLLNYIGYLQESKSKPVINEHLRAVSHYNQYLQIPDIAYQVRVRGIAKQQYTMFGEEELNRIYNSYETKAKKGFLRHSDKILLGFIIYQALDERDIERLELQHLNLQTGKLSVPGGTRRKEARTLNLEAHQVLQLHHYIENHRNKTTDKLISPQAVKFSRLHDQFKSLNKQIRDLGVEINYNIERLNQLRQSRITLWIKQHGLRKTQYMAGFKRVENIERYRRQDSEDLLQYVLQFHPLQ
jgi:hypothetical protein